MSDNEERIDPSDLQGELDQLDSITEEIDFSLDEDVSCDELRTHRRDTDEEYMDIGDHFELEPYKVTYHIRGECSCTNEEPALDTEPHRPWTEEALLRYLLIDKNLHYTQVGDAFGCHEQTVKNWAGEDHFDITVIENSERVSSKIVRLVQRRGAELSDDLSTEDRVDGSTKY